MAVIKCKMCGGALSLTEGSTVAECEYCGSIQTLPQVNDERLASFHERANDLRMSHEFDKAAEIYEKIIEETPTDADAYWSMVLCHYGIEYVEETRGGVRKPTINRAQMVSVFEDVNYKSAIKYADPAQKQVYEKEAARIDRILQRYLEISRNEPAYDVFICYKETGTDGRRTLDSVRAGEIYRELTNEGFKVFFAPVTLEDKLGEDYEPYIFAAINSAKVMVVIGTKPEYMNAVWVKNEWSRFLALAKNDSKKTLIPVYSGMDPYDMPEAFRFKQAQDMGKLGFILDLVRGIEKLVGKNTPQPVSQSAPQTKAAANSGNVAPLLQRAAIFLEDGDWESAEIYCEKVLDMEPTNGQAYLCKLLAEAKVTSKEALQNYYMPLEKLRTFRNAVRYADEATTAKLVDWNREIEDRLEREEKARQERERIQREREEQEAQFQREQAQRAEDFRKRKQAIDSAVENTASLLSAQMHDKENLENLLMQSKSSMKDQGKRRRKVTIWSVVVLIMAITLFAMLVNDAEVEPGLSVWFATSVVAAILARVRGKSVIGAFFLGFVTIGILPFCSALKGISEAVKSSTKGLTKEQESLSTRIRQLENEIDASRNALNALQEKKTALNAERGVTEND